VEVIMDWQKITIPGDEINSYTDFHKIIAKLLRFDECVDEYGCNENALEDVFPGPRNGPMLLIWANSDLSKSAIDGSVGVGVFDEIIGIFDRYKTRRWKIGLNDFDYQIK
jgi:RNAse (barnase) inhibitor barstar